MKKELVGAKIDPELVERIKVLMEKDERSMSFILGKCIEKGLPLVEAEMLGKSEDKSDPARRQRRAA